MDIQKEIREFCFTGDVTAYARLSDAISAQKFPHKQAGVSRSPSVVVPVLVPAFFCLTP